MFRAIYYTDPHQADVSPQNRSDDYPEAIFKKLSWVVSQFNRIANFVPSAVLLCGGDFFHIKEPRRTSHRVMSTLLSLFPKDSVGAHHWVVPGTHDMQAGSLSTLPKMPLHVLKSAGSLNYISGKKMFGSENEVEIIGIPFSYRGDSDINYYKEFLREKPSGVRIVLTHGTITAENYVYPTIKPTEFLDCEWDLWLNGHIHDSEGLYQVSASGMTALPRHVSAPFCVPNQRVFGNIGGLSRGSMNETNIKRTVYVADICVSGFTAAINLLPVPVASADMIFKLQDKFNASTKDAFFESFAHYLNQQLVGNKSVDFMGMVEILAQKENVDQEVLRDVKKYLEIASVGAS